MINRSTFTNSFVISLARATGRRQRISARFAAAGIPFEFVEAVDGVEVFSDQDAQDYLEFDQDYARRSPSLRHIKMVLGTLASFEKVLAIVRHRKLDQFSIFEDDAWFTPKMLDYLATLDVPDDWVGLRYGTFSPQQVNPFGPKVADGLHLSLGVKQAHAQTYKAEVLDEAQEVMALKMWPADDAWAVLDRIYAPHVLITYPYTIIHEPGYSYIADRKINPSTGYTVHSIYSRADSDWETGLPAGGYFHDAPEV